MGDVQSVAVTTLDPPMHPGMAPSNSRGGADYTDSDTTGIESAPSNRGTLPNSLLSQHGAHPEWGASS